ncbi:acyltransferase [Streptomyces venezuelae]|uniref:acyltransferase family protein n=1 Tax=Streptomyces venezuelae TaxID=54571 RepID=UPI0029587BF3|nr:acyltransferase [Streptomyces venezuelae]
MSTTALPAQDREGSRAGGSAASSAGPSATRSAGPSHGRLRALDGLRLLAALMVALYHFGGRNGDISKAWGDSPRDLFPDAAPWFAYGPLGVQFFFVISGFVICMSAWGRPLRSFLASRVARLYPAYWVAVVLVTVVFALPMVAWRTVSPTDFLANLTMFQQPMGAERVLGVCWTLWAEMRFYVLFALFVILPGGGRQRTLVFCAVWAVAAVVADASENELLAMALMPEYAPFFIGGIGLYLVHRNRRDMAGWGIAALGWLMGQHYAVAGLWHAPNPKFFSYRESWVIIAIVTLAFALIALVAVGLFDWMNWSWLTVAGALTYPFYLVHEHLGWVVIHTLHRRLEVPAVATFAATVGIMLVLAWLIHRLVERPLTPKLRRALDREIA